MNKKKIIASIICLITVSTAIISYKKFQKIKRKNTELVCQIEGVTSKNIKLQQKNAQLNAEIDSITKSYNNNCKELSHRINTISRISRGDYGSNAIERVNMDIVGTGYNFVEEINSKWRGGTATGISLIGKDWTSRIIAVDPTTIPLKHYVYIVFQDADYQKYNGWWYTADTGGKIKGNRVDFYLGAGNNVVKTTDDFGLRKAKILAIIK